MRVLWSSVCNLVLHLFYHFLISFHPVVRVVGATIKAWVLQDVRAMSNHNPDTSAPDSPHIESSDSEQSFRDSDDESGETDEDSVDEIDDAGESVYPKVAAPKVVVNPSGDKLWIPSCDDVYKPRTNQHFQTLEDAFVFYREYGRQGGFDVRKSGQKSNRSGNVVSKKIMCNCGDSPTPRKAKIKDDLAAGSSQVRRSTSRRCECQAHIVLKAAGLRGFVIMSFVEDHNHPLAVGAENMFLRCNRKVSKSQQNFIMDCSRAKIGATRAYNLAKEMVGSYENVGATVSDFKNFARDVKLGIGENDASLIIDKFKMRRKSSKEKFFFEYKTDREGHLTGLFWTDAIGQANYEVFGDIVSFDPTFRTNKYNMVFVPFTGVDNHWKNVTFGASLIAKEDYKNFKWLINTFKSAMGHAPTCVITDQCPAIKKALQLNWAHTKHRLCMWHIMNKLPSKLGPIRATDKVFMSKLKSVIYSDHSSPLEFEEGWSSVILEYKLQDNKWMSDMFRRRRSWIPAYFSDIDMAGLLRTTSRSESSNSFFQHFHERGDTLVEFFSSFESAMDKQRIRTVEDDKNSRKTPRLETPLHIEKDAAHVYTLALYYRVREEIKNACFYTSMPEMTQTDETRVFKCKDDLLKGKLFQVSVSRSNNDVECSCKFYNRFGYLCCHAFAALQQCGIHSIPRQFLKARWTKDALKNHSSIGLLETPSNCDKTERTKLKLTRVWFQFESCLDLVGDDEDKLDMVRLIVRDMESKLQKDYEHDGEPGQAHRADAFVGPVPLNEECVQNPNISKNKGSGSRIKSTREISIQSKGQRTCSICNKTEGHNARTCPTLQKQS